MLVERASHRGDAFSGAGQTNSAVTPQGHGVGVGGVNVGPAFREFHGDQTRLIVSTNPLVGLDEGKLQDWFLKNKIKTTI